MNNLQQIKGSNSVLQVNKFDEIPVANEMWIVRMSIFFRKQKQDRY